MVAIAIDNRQQPIIITAENSKHLNQITKLGHLTIISDYLGKVFSHILGNYSQPSIRNQTRFDDAVAYYFYIRYALNNFIHNVGYHNWIELGLDHLS